MFVFFMTYGNAFYNPLLAAARGPAGRAAVERHHFPPVSGQIGRYKIARAVRFYGSSLHNPLYLL